MVLKTKLSLGLGFLFAIIFALSFFCSYYVDKLSSEADSILKDNYDSIVYSKNMLASLDDTRTSISSTIFNPGDSKKLSDYYSHLFETGRAEFEKNLKAENNNITEIHEKDYVDTLNRDYAVYMNLCDKVKNGLGTTSMYFNEVLPCYEKLKQSIHSINDLNMEAVVRKNMITKQQSANVKTYMSVTATLCLILAFGYFWYFPFYVSNTISYLSKRITELLRKAGIVSDINTNDEAYIILQSIKLLEKKLGLDNSEKDSL
jgi:Four helix bundle sensory module for signal transduction